MSRPLLLAVAAASIAVVGLAGQPAQANGCIVPAAGTAADPFLISTEDNLDCLQGNSSYWGQGYYFRQTADLDMSGSIWATGIGSAATPFRGTYDGDGHSIANLTVTASSSLAGMFGVSSDDTLTQITLTGLTVTGTNGVGGLVGRHEGGLIEDVAVDGSISGVNFVGGLIGEVDDSTATTIRRSFVTGSVTGSADRIGGLVGQVALGARSLTIVESYSRASVNGWSEVGGLVGTYVQTTLQESLTIQQSYAQGPVNAVTATSGGLIGCLYEDYSLMMCLPAPMSALTINDTYWDTQTTGESASPGSLTGGKTTAQMTSLGTFLPWDITDTTPAPSSTWGICEIRNDGYPFLQWYAGQRAWSCTPPDPPGPAPAPTPATAPREVVAIAGERLATVSWQAPASSGSFPVTTYLVTAAPGGHTCLTGTLSCHVSGLTNGTAYSFTVAALTGAGWGPSSAPSNSIVPRSVAIRITAQRVGRTLVITGTSTGLDPGSRVQPWIRLGGEGEPRTTASTTVLSSEGEFTWTRRLNPAKSAEVYVEVAGQRSNAVTVQ